MSDSELRLAEALNQLQDANLRQLEGEIAGFVHDYFLHDHDDDEDDDSDVDSSCSSDSSADEWEALDEVLVENQDEDDEESLDNDRPVTVVAEFALDIGDAGDHERVNAAEEDDERAKTANFRCLCNLFNGNPCSQRYSVEEFIDSRREMEELARDEKDMLILGMIRGAANNGTMTACSKRQGQSDRRHQRSTYMYHGHPVCVPTFLFLHNMSTNKLTALRKHHRQHGCTPRVHGNSKKSKLPGHLTYEDNLRVRSFITNYAEVHAILLPGRIPGYKRDDIRLLPSYENKTKIWRVYEKAMEDSDNRAVAQSTFRKLWNKFCPYIVCCKPMADVCWVCQRNNSLLYRSANMSDEAKQQRCKDQQDHLTYVTTERNLYRELVEAAKTTAEQQGVVGLGPNIACSRKMSMHYSFDFAQQVHYPSDPMQPGPVYFLTPRKLGIFGVHCEGIPQQVNYLVDEGVTISKGSNAVLSFLHHFFGHYALGETAVHLHCDNCSGQNKNKFMLWYLVWRCLWGFHQSITLHFMVVGHTKFAPDWCFGLVKQCFRRTPVSCLEDVVDVVKNSTTTRVNIPQLVGNEAGNVYVRQYNWQEFLTPFLKPLHGIKSFRHFRCSSDEPGVVYARTSLGDPEVPFQLLKDIGRRPQADCPEPETPPGLDPRRQWYLFDKIREFCSEVAKDKACPRPEAPKPH